MDIIAIYVTHSNQHNADMVSDHLFRKKLIACVNSFAINNTYAWKGKLEKNEEIVTIYKTKSQNWIAVKEAIKEIHPYDIPCIMKMDTRVNTGYGQWVVDSVA